MNTKPYTLHPTPYMHRWKSIDATSRDTGPIQNYDLAVGLYFFGVSTFSLLVLLNLFISVFVCIYVEQSNAYEHRQKLGLADVVPLGKPTRKMLPVIAELEFFNPLRLWCHQALESFYGQALVNVCIVGTLFSMLGESYHRGYTQGLVLQALDVFFTFVFGTETLMRMASLGVGKLMENRWLCFDYLIYAFGVADLVISNDAAFGKLIRSARWVRALRTLRLLRVLRSYRLLRTMKGVMKLLNTLTSAMPMLLNLVVVLVIAFFCFASLGVKMYGSMCVDGVSRSGLFLYIVW
jgi:hypothetical protein